MPTSVVIQRDVAGFQAQYGTLREAIEVYLDGRMPVEQASAFERIVDPAWVHAIAATRLSEVLSARLRD